jgi:hypothetical protein
MAIQAAGILQGGRVQPDGRHKHQSENDEAITQHNITVAVIGGGSFAPFAYSAPFFDQTAIAADKSSPSFSIFYLRSYKCEIVLSYKRKKL